MICNITKGNDFYGCITYVMRDAHYVNTNMSGDSPTELAWEFRFISNSNERVQKPVFHISFNPEPNDRPLSDLEYSAIAQDLLEGLGLGDNQFILCEHQDTEFNGKVRPHCHLIVNRVGFDGKCNDDSYDYYRAQKVLRQIEKDYKLIECPSSWEVEEKKGPPLRQDETKYIQEAIKKAAADKPEMPTFISRLQAQDIDVKCRITRTGKLQGISYAYNDKAFKGRQLGKSFTHQGIQSHLGVIYKQSHKQQIELLLNAPKGDSDTASASITDNTNVAESTLKNFVSVVPSVERTFGTKEDNKAKKKLVNKAKNNKQVSNTENTEPVAPPRKAYKSFVPGIEKDFTPPKSNELDSTQTKHESSVHSIKENFDNPSDSEPEVTNAEHTQPVKPAPEPDAVEIAVKIAGYMGSTFQTEIKGDSMRANLSFDDNISTLEVRRIDSNEVILSANHTISGGWVINNSLKFTNKEKKRIDRLKERSSKQLQQPITEKKGFEQ
ncbi:MAG: relaxase/mobilization nuclease domain-containing protein [Cyanobacteria bacterium P01_D01_bin.116]